MPGSPDDLHKGKVVRQRIALAEACPRAVPDEDPYSGRTPLSCGWRRALRGVTEVQDKMGMRLRSVQMLALG
jgi:hypothetical protein